MIWYDMLMIWYDNDNDMIWYDMKWYNIIRYDISYHVISCIMIVWQDCRYETFSHTNTVSVSSDKSNNKKKLNKQQTKIRITTNKFHLYYILRNKKKIKKNKKKILHALIHSYNKPFNLIVNICITFIFTFAEMYHGFF